MCAKISLLREQTSEILLVSVDAGYFTFIALANFRKFSDLSNTTQLANGRKRLQRTILLLCPSFHP